MTAIVVALCSAQRLQEMRGSEGGKKRSDREVNLHCRNRRLLEVEEGKGDGDAGMSSEGEM